MTDNFSELETVSPFENPPEPARRRVRLKEDERENVANIYRARIERGDEPRFVKQAIIKRYGMSHGSLQTILRDAGAIEGKPKPVEKPKKKTKAEQWLSGADAPRTELADIHGKPVRVELKRDGYLEVGSVKLKMKEAQRLADFMAEYFR